MNKLKNKWIIKPCKFIKRSWITTLSLLFLFIFFTLHVKAASLDPEVTCLEEGDYVYIKLWTEKVVDGHYTYTPATTKFTFTSSQPIRELSVNLDTGYKLDVDYMQIAWDGSNTFNPVTSTWHGLSADFNNYNGYGLDTKNGSVYFQPKKQNSYGWGWLTIEDKLGITHENCTTKYLNVIVHQELVSPNGTLNAPKKLSGQGTIGENISIYDGYKTDLYTPSKPLYHYGDTMDFDNLVAHSTWEIPDGYSIEWHLKNDYSDAPLTDFKVATYTAKNTHYFDYTNFYAKLIKNTYTISYELGGGQSEEVLPATYQVLETDMQIPSLASISNRQFDGWSVKKEGSSVWTKLENGKLPAGTFGNLTLKAGWIYEANCIMHYDPDNFVGDGIYRMGLKVSDQPGVTNMVETNILTSRSSSAELSAAAYECTAQGYHFDGWYFTQDFKENSKVVFSAYPVTQDTHIYAKWSCEQHSFKPIEGTAQTATCTQAGKEADQKCEKCGATIEGKTIPALGHDYVYSKDLSTEPTQTSVGSKISVCSRCEDIKIETIPKLPKDDTGSGSDTPQTSQTDTNKPADKEQKQDAGKPADAAPSVPDKQTTATPTSDTNDPKGPVSDSEGNQFKKTNYTNGTFELEFTGTNAAGDVQIPSTVKNGNDVMKVTSIASEAFKDNKQITSVILPSGIKKVGDNTFKGATNLKSVVIPSSVTVIGKSAFEKTALTKIVIPDSVKTIEKGAYKNVQAKTLKIGKGVTVIGDSAFEGCKKLKSVTIPGKVTKIGKKAFYNCKSLKRVVFKGIKFKKAGSKAFKKCKKGILFKCPKEKLKAYKKLLKGKY